MRNWGKQGRTSAGKHTRARRAPISGEAYQKGPRFGHAHLRAGLAAEYSSRCVFCGKELPLAALKADHVIPKSRGGTDAWENRLWACVPCHGAKGNRTPEEWGVGLRSRREALLRDPPGAGSEGLGRQRL